MACEAIHTQLLSMLLTICAELLILIVFSTRNSLKLTPLSDSSTSSEDHYTIEPLKLAFSLGLHGVLVLCVVAVVSIHGINALSTRLPVAVIIVILIFAILFNLAGAILLYVYTPPRVEEKSRAIFGCAIVSSYTMVFSVIVTVVFIRVPLTKDGGGNQPPPPAQQQGVNPKSATTLIN
ncbi:hypothetical protein Q1695_005963 [Nippostrongylus brasiliensis]|nr:hypothetical protein Q1695_005963 [Nippostrongylus brasiliensis]